MGITIHTIPVLTDNYSYVVEPPNKQDCLIIDPGEAAPLIDFFEKNHCRPSWIFNTHHHWDHVNGNIELKTRFPGLKTAVSLIDSQKMTEVDQFLRPDDSLLWKAAKTQLMFTPGHTLGQISLYLPDKKALFTGDTLFLFGCGRIFEGDAAMMWDSMLRIRALPDDTEIFCGHEYTAENLKWAASVDLDNTKTLLSMSCTAATKVLNGDWTVPGQLGEQKNYNPFLRCDKDFQMSIGSSASGIIPRPSEKFAELRKSKDKWKSG